MNCRISWEFHANIVWTAGISHKNDSEPVNTYFRLRNVRVGTGAVVSASLGVNSGPLQYLCVNSVFRENEQYCAEKK